MPLSEAQVQAEIQALQAIKEFLQDFELQGPTLLISLEMTLDSSVYSLSSGSAGRPKMSFTITSHFSHPITICTYHTPLDPSTAWHGKGFLQNFTATDISNGKRVWFRGRQPQRAYSLVRHLGHSDREHFLTLHPNVPVTVSYPFRCSGWNERKSGFENYTPRGPEFRGEVFRQHFEPGHRYRVGVAYRPGEYIPGQLQERGPDQMVLWWRYGTKEDVLEPKEAPLHKGEVGWSEHKIRIRGIPDVELAIKE